MATNELHFWTHIKRAILLVTQVIADVVLPGSAEEDENEPGRVVLRRIEALERAMQSR